MRKMFVLICVSILLMAGQCDGKKKYLKPYIQFSDNEDAFEEPNLTYFPGDVVSRNKKTGKMVRLAKLKNVEIQESSTIGSSFENGVKSNLKLNLKLLGISNLDFLGEYDREKQINFNYKEDETSSLTFKNGILNYNNELSKIKEDITKASENINFDFANNDILLIVEVKRAKKMLFGFEKKLINQGDIGIKIAQKLVGLDSDIKWNQDSNYQVKYTKDEPYHTRYNKVYLKLTGGIGGVNVVIDDSRN